MNKTPRVYWVLEQLTEENNINLKNNWWLFGAKQLRGKAIYRGAQKYILYPLKELSMSFCKTYCTWNYGSSCVQQYGIIMQVTARKETSVYIVLGASIYKPQTIIPLYCTLNPFMTFFHFLDLINFDRKPMLIQVLNILEGIIARH